LHSIGLRNAPGEIEELTGAYMAMTESVIRSEAELKDLVRQKEVLLRAAHHRVKNNFQLISSIMNIQLRSARSGEARDLLKNLQERIMSPATVHRGLYQTSRLADVRASELIFCGRRSGFGSPPGRSRSSTMANVSLADARTSSNGQHTTNADHMPTR